MWNCSGPWLIGSYWYPFPRYKLSEGVTWLTSSKVMSWPQVVETGDQRRQQEQGHQQGFQGRREPTGERGIDDGRFFGCGIIGLLYQSAGRN